MSASLLKYFRRVRLSNNIYIVAYHGVAEKRKDRFWERNFTLLSDFKEHIRLFKNYPILSTNQLLDYVLAHKAPAKPSFYITFDDGYKNNLIAAELFARGNIPWSLFLSTQSISTGAWIWPNELALLFRLTVKNAMLFRGAVYNLSSEDAKKESFNEIRRSIKQLCAPERIVLMEELKQQMGIGEIESVREAMPEFDMLSWNDVKSLAGHAEVGAHGVAHELLHSNQQAQIIQFELTQSKKDIEAHVSKTCLLYAYPNGDHCEAAVNMANAVGYQLGFTMRQSKVAPRDQQLLLPRIGAAVDIYELRARLSL